MPKLKTYKAAAKRFKVTGSGKILRMKQGRSHLKRKKSKRSIRAMRQYHRVAKADRKRVRLMLHR